MLIKELLNLSPEELIGAVERGEVSDAIIWSCPLDEALVNKQVEIAGNFIGVIGGTTATTNVDIEFTRVGTGAINFTQGLYMTRPFARFFVSADAQAGETIKIIISNYAPIFAIQDNRSTTLQTTYLSTIQTNTGNTKTAVDQLKAALRALSGDTGTQIVKNGSAVNQTTLIHTVTAAKTFYLSSYAGFYSMDASGTIQLCVTNEADAVQYNLLNCPTGVLAKGSFNQALPTPIKIPAGYKIKVIGSNTNSLISANITGWEE